MKTTFTFLLFSIFASVSFTQDHFDQATKKNEEYFKLPPNVTKEDYLPKTIIFKVKPDYRDFCNNDRIENLILNTILDELNLICARHFFITEFSIKT